jgi:hypothetical protein
MAARGKSCRHLPILVLRFAARVFMEMKSMFTRLQTFKLGYQYQAFLMVRNANCSDRFAYPF